MKHIKKSTIIPLTLLAYLAIMSILGLSYFHAGRYIYYFGIIGITLLIIILLHFVLKKREQLQRKRENEQNSHKPDSENY